MYFEVLWYLEKERMNPVFKEFKTKKGALNFYQKHKNDNDKFGFWVTKRDEDGYVVDDLIAFEEEESIEKLYKNKKNFEVVYIDCECNGSIFD